MTKTTLIVITLTLVIAIFTPLSSYLVLRQFRASRRAIEVFDDDGVELAKFAVKSWQVPRILKRAGKIGWQLDSQEQTLLGHPLLILRKSNDEAAPAKQLFESLLKSGFTYHPVREELCRGECPPNA